MKSKYIILILVFAFAVNSCATILQGKKQSVRINSTPQGASVYINGFNTEKITPCKVRFSRKVAPTAQNRQNEVVYTLKKYGYADLQYRDKSTFNWIVGIDFFCGVLPAFVDFSNGSHRVYLPELNLVLNESNEQNTISNNSSFPKNENQNYKYLASSDVDYNIPVTEEVYPYRFALIIGNEDYQKYNTGLSKEINVDYARNDAHAFKDYANKTLGIPEKNILFQIDATSGQMNESIEKLILLSKYAGEKAELFFYYAGHGLPDEQTKEPYLIPVDVSGKNLDMAINLKELYLRFNEYSTKRTLIFLDACFSGGARNQGLISARSIRVKPKEEKLQGNILVFNASSENQSALPLIDQRHGLFTYFLLKELQDSKGDIKVKTLAEVVSEKVAIESVLRNSKEQKPEINLSPDAYDAFEKWKLND